MQKRAGLARAIVRRCDIVLYDEPTSGLDPVTSVTIDNLIKRVNEERHITSIVVTHDLRQALLCSDRIVMLKDARVQADCTPDEFVSSDIPAVKDFLAARFITKETYEKLRENYEKKR
jgi:phospholipid/cholesterol/gamma-HCH transport system ATP-binding protein